MRKAIIDGQGLVQNVIEIEPEATFSLLEGYSLIDADNGSPGDTWDGEEFEKPELPEPEPRRNILAELDSHEKRIRKLEKE